MRIRVLLCTVLVCGLSWVSWQPAAAQSPSFDCTKARLPDEIAICRTPELAEFDNTIAAAYAYLKTTRGRAYADQSWNSILAAEAGVSVRYRLHTPGPGSGD